MDNNYNMIPEEFDEDNFRVEKLQVNKDKTMEKSKWDFIYSTRFWSLVLGAVMFYLRSKGIVGDAEMILANTILGGFIAIKTVDRFGEKRVEAAEVNSKTTTVSMPSNVSSVSATTSSNGEN